MNPRVSVLINTYNYGSFIEEAIDSALAQDFPAEQMEIIVVDDGSTDDTAERVKKYGDSVRYFYKENGDQPSAVAFGVSRARGEVVAILDADDVWLPSKVSRVMVEFARHPGAVMVYHRYVFWDCRENTSWEPDDPSETSGDVLADRRKLLTYCAPPMSSLVFRREALERISDIPLNRRFAYDLYLTSAALFLGPIACVPDVLTKNRIHGKNRWVAGKSGPDAETIRRRIASWKDAAEILRDWIHRNASESLWPQADLLLLRHGLAQQQDEFLLKPPGRMEFSRFLWRKNRLLREAESSKLFAINELNAIASLVTGYKGFELLQGFWRRLDRAKVELDSLLRRRSTRGTSRTLET